jgi:hypothetical protein
VALLEGTLTLELSSDVAYRRDRLLDYARERALSTGLIRQSLTTPSADLDSAVQQSFARIDSMFTEMQ